MHFVSVVGVIGAVVASGLTGWFLNKPNNHVPVQASPESAVVVSDSREAVLAVDFVSVRPDVTSLPRETLSPEEIAGLVFMREEEKLARDVYTVLYEKWGVPIFSNIAQSEQTHTEAVRTLLAKYAVTDPVTSDAIGVFVNLDLQKLYNDLTARGERSLSEALSVGALIEDLDIADLQKQVALTDNDDVKLVYENLLRGSRNHLRSFNSQLTARGVAYTPEYLSQEAFNDIISAPKETGSGQGGRGRGWGN